MLVDEAHGAHLGLHPGLPSSALAGGADVTVQSTHKVLGALTQVHCPDLPLIFVPTASQAVYACIWNITQFRAVD
jgi:hypothetical protein